MSESTIQRACFAFLDALPECFVWRNNTGAMRKRGRLIRFGVPGAPDILGSFRGRSFACEIKDPANHTWTGKQSPAQAAWQARWQGSRGIYLLVRSVEELATWVDEANAAPKEKPDA